MAQPPRIALLMGTSRAYERGLIRGIANYSTLHGPWNFFRRQRGLSPHEYRNRSGSP